MNPLIRKLEQFVRLSPDDRAILMRASSERVRRFGPRVDITREEFQEFVLHFAYYAGWPRASALEMAYYEACARIDAGD